MADEKTPVEQLAELKARRKELADARAVRDAQTDIAEQLAAEKLELANEEAVDKAESAHGKIGAELAAVKTPMGVVLVKRPNPLIFRRFKDKGKFDTETMKTLVFGCLVHPSRDEYDAIDDKYPSLTDLACKAVAHLAGLSMETITGKS